MGNNNVYVSATCDFCRIDPTVAAVAIFKDGGVQAFGACNDCKSQLEEIKAAALEGGAELSVAIFNELKPRNKE